MTPGREGEQDESVCTTFPKSHRHHHGDSHRPRTRRPPGERRTRGQPAAKCDNRNNNTISKLTECVTADGVNEHLEAFQAIADANGGNRAANTPGYDASVDYVVDTLDCRRLAGHDRRVRLLRLQGPAELEQTHADRRARGRTRRSPAPGTGEVTGNVIPVDLVLASPRDAVTSGCEATDFAGSTSRATIDIALVQRGTCEFGVKAANAQTAGAEAVIIMNQGNTPDRCGVLIERHPDR